MSYQAEILADSTSPAGTRLTTFRVCFPRIILAEVNTHRVLSRNSASSRAIPPEKWIAKIDEEPFVPDFYKREKGMAANELLPGWANRRGKHIWLNARDDALRHTQSLLNLGVDKAHANRLLEPFMWHTAIISGTDWDNFFALRTDEAAQPEFREVALLMQEALAKSEPYPLSTGEWHLPGLGPGDELAEAFATRAWKYWAHVSAGRLARVSFDNLDREDSQDRAYQRALGGPKYGHWSPMEHPAMALDLPEKIGNFEGFRQLRKFYDHEENFAKLREEHESQSESTAVA